TVELMLDILRNLKVPLGSEVRLLDFGCGPGQMVYEFRKRGLQSFGVDIFEDFTKMRDKCLQEGLINQEEEVFRLASMDPYRHPYPDNQFDIIVSDAVFEHVHNYKETFSEIHRVLK